MKKVLITGATGFAGGHLAEALLATGNARVFGVSLHTPWRAGGVNPPVMDQVTLHSCDLCDSARLEAILCDVQPDHIYHLAGYAHLGRSFREPDAAWTGNLTA